MIPGAKSCGSVGKLGDRADPEGATASNGDVRGTGRQGGKQVSRGGDGYEKVVGREERIRGSPSRREDRGRFPKRGGRRG